MPPFWECVRKELEANMTNRKGQLGVGTVIMVGILLIIALPMTQIIQEVGDDVVGGSNLTNNTTAHLIINYYPFFFLVLILLGAFLHIQPQVQRFIGG